MTYLEIYEAAVRLVDEIEAGDSPDYESRAPYLLGSFYTEQIPLQKKLDAANRAEPIEYEPCLYVDLESHFPLSDELIAPAVNYLAAMLVIDENEEMSDQFFDRYIDGVASIAASLPASLHPIKDCYNCLI